MGHRMQTGRLGEALAARALEAEGWRVLARGYRDGPRELDLVVVREGVLAFVEVKTRRGGTVGEALASIGSGKRRELERAATGWLSREAERLREFRIRRIRFDAVAVMLRPGLRPEVVRVEGAWVRGPR